MKKHLNIVVYGFVQGVFFRTTAKQEAEKVGIKVVAENKPDGSVYIEAEGEEKNLDQFIKWCHQGSDLAEVEKVEVHEI